MSINAVNFGITYMPDIKLGPMDQAKRAEKLGFGVFWAPEFLSIPTLEPFSLLAGAAQHTKNIRLGTGVAGLALRSPFQIAKGALTVDLLSNGRLNLGLGIGGIVPKDLAIEGISFRERGKISNERLNILYRLLTEENVTHKGHYFQFEDLTIEPTSIQMPSIPIWIGARWTGKIAEGALRRCGMYGNTFIFPADTPKSLYLETKEKVKQYAETAGRDPDQIEWAGTLWTCLGPTKDQALAKANQEITRILKIPWEVDPTRSYGLGTPQDCIETIEEFRNLGLTNLMITPCWPIAESTAQMDQFAAEVIPHFA